MVTKESPPAAKIELFRSLFRGRADVYPRRFVSRKTGKAGYAPACANEWVRGVCEKPRIIHCTEEHPRHFALPRGCLDEVSELLKSLKIKSVMRDERYSGTPLDVTFHGTLRPEQLAAAEVML